MTIPRNLSNLAPGTSTGGVLSASYGGTGLTTLTDANNALYSTSASALTAGTLPVAAGGTGSTTLTANNVLLGNGTSALQVVAPGTTGNVLTSNGTTWASSAAPGGGSWIYLSTVTASNVATADIETTFSSTYNNYAIVASSVLCVSATRVMMRFKVSGSYSSSALYSYANMYNNAQDPNTFAGTGGTIETEIVINPSNVTSSANLTTNFICYLYNAASTSLYKTGNIVGQSWNGSNLLNFNNTVTYKDTPAVTGVRISAITGNVSGTFRLYGIKNS